MNASKQQLLDRIDADRDMLVDYLQSFIRCASPNPPGDTLDAALDVSCGAMLQGRHRLERGRFLSAFPVELFCRCQSSRFRTSRMRFAILGPRPGTP